MFLLALGPIVLAVLVSIFAPRFMPSLNKYPYEPLPNLKASFTSGEIETTSNGGSVMNFNFKFKNASKDQIIFDVGEIEISVSEKISVQVIYNSLASNSWPAISLKQGYSEHELLVYFDELLNEDTDFTSYVVFNHGLSIRK